MNSGSRGKLRRDSRSGPEKRRKTKPGSAPGNHGKILALIAKIPHGKVSTYGAIAAAAGIPNGARQTARALHRSDGVPWHRVLGAGGVIKLTGDNAFEQRFRLQSEGVAFRGNKVDMKLHEHRWKKQQARKNNLVPSRAGRPRHIRYGV